MTQDSRLYRDLAKYYDAQYSRKDYEAEVHRLDAVVRRYGRSRGSSWLDVACGTGRHLALLRSRHRDCVGVDASVEMLRIARKRLPGVPLVHGDMRSFRLDREFDVVTCLFSAIGHMTTERDLETSFANFARHLKPGGVAIVEPWILPARARPGHVHLLTVKSGKDTVVRLAYSRIRGRHTIIRYHYLIGEWGRGIRHIEVTDRGLMVDPVRLQHLMKRAGLRPRFLSRGFYTDRGLLIGVKSTPASRSRQP